MVKLLGFIVVVGVIVAVVITMQSMKKGTPSPTPGQFGPVVVTIQMPNPLPAQ